MLSNPRQIHQDNGKFLEDVKKEISLTQQTLAVASTMIDSIDRHRDQAQAAAEKLEIAVSNGFEAVVREIGKQGDRATGSTVDIGNKISAGLIAVVEEVGKQGRQVVASSQRMSAELSAVVDEVGKQGREVVASSQKIEELCTKTFEESKQEIQALRISFDETTFPKLADMHRILQSVQEQIAKNALQLEINLGKTILSNELRNMRTNRSLVKRWLRVGGFRSENIYENQVTIETNRNDYLTLGFKAAQHGKSYKKIFKISLPLLRRIWQFRAIWTTIAPNYKPQQAFSLRADPIVPSGSPFFDQIRQGNIHAVQQLFSQRRASPFDRMVGGISPCDEALKGLMRATSEEAEKNAFQMFRFLLQTGAIMDISVNTMTKFLISNLKRWMASTTTHADCLQWILENSEDNPLYETGACSVIMIENESDPFFQSLASEEYWPITLGEIPFDAEAKFFGETDRMLLSDPTGSRMEVEILSGRHYVSVVPDLILSDDECMTFDMSAPLSLLMQAARSTRDDIHSACRKRISKLLRVERDTSLSKFLRSLSGLGKENQLSATRYARQLNLTDLWREALENAGWTPFEIHDLFDEELYAGVSELFSKPFLYITQDNCRSEFIRKLCTGGFARLDNKDIEQESRALRLNLGVSSSFDVFRTIRSATSAFHQRVTPGSWPDDSRCSWLYPEDQRLVPGVDFVLPEDSIHRRPIDWSKYMEELDQGHDSDVEETDTEDWYDASEAWEEGIFSKNT